MSSEIALQSHISLFLELTVDAALLIDCQGLIVQVNPEAELLLGYGRGEMEQMHFDQLVPEPIRETHNRYHAQFVEKPEKRKMGNGRLLSCLAANGAEIPVEIAINPLEDEGELLFLVRLNDVRQQANEQDRLFKAHQQADQANKAKSRFLAAASHDLRQPLQAISMYLGVLAGNLDFSEKSRTIAHARMSLDSVQQLLDSLLDISKLESGKVPIENRNFVIADVLTRISNNALPQAQRNGLALSIIKSTAVVHTDPHLLEQLLANLISNAIRYTPAGGRVILGCLRRGRYLEIRLIDTGVGIPASDLENIFDEYVQLAPGGKTAESGLGLGLAIVRLIAELLELKLHVGSEPGKGTTFAVIIPFAESVEMSAGEAAVRDNRLQRPLFASVLLIEDDESVLESTRLFLQVSGLIVLTATTKKEAMAVARKSASRIDLIISDYNLKDRNNGLEVIRQIRTLIGRAVPAILITGDTSVQVSKAAEKTGCQLTRKPASPIELMRTIRGLLPERTLRAHN